MLWTYFLSGWVLGRSISDRWYQPAFTHNLECLSRRCTMFAKLHASESTAADKPCACKEERKAGVCYYLLSHNASAQFSTCFASPIGCCTGLSPLPKADCNSFHIASRYCRQPR